MSGSPLAFDFDFVNLIISVKSSGEYAIENDGYSDWKELLAANAGGIAASVPPAFLEANDRITRVGGSVGGNPISATQSIAPYFFINNIDGWRLRPPEEDGETSITGNLFPLDPDTPFIIPTVGAFTQLMRLVVSPQAIVDSSGGGGLTASQERLLQDIHGQVQRQVFINTEQSPGGLYGYQQEPFNNWSDAVDYAEANGLQVLALETDATVDRQLKNFEINGIGGLPQIDLNGQVMDGSTIRNCEIAGTQGQNGGGTGQLVAFDCAFNEVRNFDGAASLVGVIGTLEFQNGATSLINELIPFVAGNTVVLDLKAADSPSLPSTVAIQNASGPIQIANMDDAGDSLSLFIKRGSVEILPSCVAGNIFIAGTAEMTDNSGSGCTVTHSAMIHPEDITLMKALLGGDAVVSLDDQTVTIYNNDVSPRVALATYSISADTRVRTRLT